MPCSWCIGRTFWSTRATVFRQVTQDDDFGVILSGNTPRDERDAALQERTSVFAMIQTLSRPEWLARFSPNHFDYVVIDEFHHSEAASYQKVLAHFDPEFLLGLTATPERMDGRDVLRFCDFNIAYEARCSTPSNKAGSPLPVLRDP
jgi:ERCC4-related helicase